VTSSIEVHPIRLLQFQNDFPPKKTDDGKTQKLLENKPGRIKI
jgi:hypothetical protein